MLRLVEVKEGKKWVKWIVKYSMTLTLLFSTLIHNFHLFSFHSTKQTLSNFSFVLRLQMDFNFSNMCNTILY